ncbi:hypothetical protein M422DRAFT_258081 [Sphaerobolus stellatus SS14]|uniref:Uncharacterized protein n=1 Tax=Sphaerobolus stellatus (strain SS14) TaxID=990650 RepID=A0A0C9VCB2_SPHS4|nr:hypothetical protein M422DRAFT_258081 [Sphaerobolus stellatus SS14]
MPIYTRFETPEWQEMAGSNTTYLPPAMDNLPSKGVTIEAKRLLGVHRPSLPYRIETTLLYDSERRWHFKDYKQDFSERWWGKMGPEAILLLEPRWKLKWGMHSLWLRARAFEKHLTIAESVTTIVDNVSKGGRKTAEKINSWKPVWSKFDALIKLSEKIAEIHPYAKIGASVLLSAYNIWKAQNTRDQDMFELLNTIYELCNFVHDAAPTEIVPAQHNILQKIMEQIIDCSQFISSYCDNHSFALKAVKHIFTSVDDAIIKYTRKTGKGA